MLRIEMETTMKRTSLIAATIVVAVGFSLVPFSSDGDHIKPITGSYNDALRKAEKDGKPLMIDFYTDWCGWCKKMDALMEQAPDEMAKFAYYRVDAEKDRALAQKFKVTGYPTVVFVKPDGSEFHRWRGAYRTVDALKSAMAEVLEKAGTTKAAK